MENKILKCCICGNEIKDLGNDPSPIEHKKNERCCDSCSDNIVVPVRIMMLGVRKRRK